MQFCDWRSLYKVRLKDCGWRTMCRVGLEDHGRKTICGVCWMTMVGVSCFEWG